jgi:hypothetical protein
MQAAREARLKRDYDEMSRRNAIKTSAQENAATSPAPIEARSK